MPLVALLALLQLPDSSLALSAFPTLTHRNGRVPPAVSAVFADRAPRMDGVLDEAAWSRAEPVSEFRRDVPSDGNAASERTEVRVVYTLDALYVGARLYDADPTRISRRLSRRDSFFVFNDVFFVLIDSYHDHRTSFTFGVTPAGERRDLISVGDGRGNRDASWDPVWEAKTTIDSLGWTAELRIPFSQLRFPPGDEQVWGIQFRRDIRHAGEAVDWSWAPRTEPGQTSKYGHLLGLKGIPAPRRLEVLPYTVSQARLTEGADPRSPFDDGSVSSLSGGIDLKYGVTSDLTLDATINPDFGQVEADPAVVNLSAFETFFEERRPFFVEGAGIMQFGLQDQGFNFFYSRRIGRSPSVSAKGAAAYVDQPIAASILGAAKLTGRTRSGWSLGALAALTGREFARLADADGRPRPSVPVEPRAGYGVLRLRRDLREGQSGFGFLATATGRDLADPAFAGLRSGALAGGIDFFHRFHRETFEIRGGFGLSRIGGDTAAINRAQRSSTRYLQRPDQSYFPYDSTRQSLSGVAGELNFSKIGGNWLYTLSGSLISPGLELNDAGFQTQGDRIALFGRLQRRWVSPTRVFRTFETSLHGFQALNFGGTGVRRNLEWSANGEFLNFWGFRAGLERGFRALDDRGTRGGPLIVQPARWEVEGSVRSDGRRLASGNLNLGYTWNEEGGWSFRVGPDITLRSSGALSVSFSPNYSRSHDVAFYVGQTEDPTASATFGRRYLFARLDQHTLGLTTRVNLVLTPNLSVQLWAQPFVASGDYQRFQEFTTPRTYDFREFGTQGSTLSYNPADSTYTADPDGAGPGPAITFGDPDFRVRSLRSNLVVRWEFRPGSTIFLVWNQSRAFRALDPRFRAFRDLSDLWGDDMQNVFLIKANYYFAL
jgi:hypothetical protein